MPARPLIVYIMVNYGKLKLHNFNSRKTVCKKIGIVLLDYKKAIFNNHQFKWMDTSSETFRKLYSHNQIILLIAAIQNKHLLAMLTSLLPITIVYNPINQ